MTELTVRSGGGVRLTLVADASTPMLPAVSPFWKTWPFTSVWTMK